MQRLHLNGPGSYLYVQGPKWEYRNDADDPHTGYYIPARIMSLLRPGRDIAIVPGNAPAVREFARFCCETLGLSEEQILFTSGARYQVQRDARKELVEKLKERTGGGIWTMVPYSVSYSVNALAVDLGLPVLGDAPQTVRRIGTKAILHPNAVPELRPDYLPILSDYVPGIPVPRGYLATTAHELQVARKRLYEEGCQTLMLKPSLGSAGEGIIDIREDTDLTGYPFALGPALIEERLVADMDTKGEIIAPSIQYLGSDLGQPSDQIMKGMSHAGNRVPSSRNASFQEEFAAMSRRILDWAKPAGPGGFDVLSVNGKPVLIDINLGRWTGAHPGVLFQGRYAPGSCFTCWKIVPQSEATVWEFWNKLHQHRIALIPGETETGVFPICYLPGMWALIGAYGKTPEEVAQLEATVRSFT